MNRIVGIAVMMGLVLPSVVFGAGEQWGFTDTQVYDAQKLTTGSFDVVVALIDNGFDAYHPDLQGNVWKNVDEVPDNGVDDDKNGYIDDVWGWNFIPGDYNGDGIIEELGNNNPRPDVVHGGIDGNKTVHHGTLVAGLIGATGGQGILEHVQLMNLKVVGNSGNGSLSYVASAIRYAVDNGADVINMSLVGEVDTGVRDAVKYAYDHNVAVVAAAGNDWSDLNTSPRYPVCVDQAEDVQWVLGVSAIGEDHRLARFSNTGSDCIDITAPGVNVTSTMRYSPRNGLPDLIGGGWNGTSFAVPFVSAAVAMVKSIQPTWTVEKIYHAILSTVHKTPPADEAAYANLYGYGKVQLANAVEYAASQMSTYHAIKGVVGVTPDSFMLKNGTEELRPELKGADHVVSYKNGFVVVDGKQVRTYDLDWKLATEWNAPWNVASVAVGNFSSVRQTQDASAEKDVPEIVLAPGSAQMDVFRVYSMRGEERSTYQEYYAHTGAAVSTISRTGMRQDNILVSYVKNGTQLFQEITIDHEIVRSMVLSDLSHPTLASGDIDGDGKQEYIAAGGDGDVPFLTYFDDDGTFLRTFYAYESGHRGGISLLVGDVTGDGVDDVITEANGLVRVWDRRSRKQDTWTLSTPISTLIPLY